MHIRRLLFFTPSHLSNLTAKFKACGMLSGQSQFDW